MIFHENRLPADDSHEISYLFFKLGNISQNLSSAAVVIGALRVNINLLIRVPGNLKNTQTIIEMLSILSRWFCCC